MDYCPYCYRVCNRNGGAGMIVQFFDEFVIWYFDVRIREPLTNRKVSPFGASNIVKKNLWIIDFLYLCLHCVSAAIW